MRTTDLLLAAAMRLHPGRLALVGAFLEAVRVHALTLQFCRFGVYRAGCAVSPARFKRQRTDVAANSQ